MASQNPYFLNDYDTLTLETDDSRAATDVSVAGIKNVTIEAEFQTFERLYTADSTKVESQAQAELLLPIEIEFAKWDGAFAEEWLGGEGSSVTSYSDTTDPQKFKLTSDFRSKNGNDQIEVTISGITFPSIPLVDMGEGEYASWNISGAGTDITKLSTSTV